MRAEHFKVTVSHVPTCKQQIALGNFNSNPQLAQTAQNDILFTANDNQGMEIKIFDHSLSKSKLSDPLIRVPNFQLSKSVMHGVTLFPDSLF